MAEIKKKIEEKTKEKVKNVQKEVKRKVDEEINFEKKMTTLSTTEFMLVILVGIIIGAALTTVAFNKEAKREKNKYIQVDDNVQALVETYTDIMNNYYLDVDSTKIINGGIKGMLEAVDEPYTTFMETTTYDNFNITLNGSYEGLGVEISKLNDQIVIVGLFADSPAIEAGLQLGDIIISIDDKSSTDMTTSDFSTYVRNSEKKDFKLVIRRDEKERTYTITKRHIELKSVISKLYEESGKKIGYIYMSIFASNSYTQFKKELKSLEEQNIDSLIIDLRDNSGGDLETTTNIISLFMNSDKVIFQMETRDGTREKTYSKGNVDKEYPIVVLVNGNTASASEVLTSALKDNLNATIIGEKTFGKGTVQTLSLTSTMEQYKMTTKKWLTPNGNWIHGEGIKPDVEVKLNENTDNQLEAAKKYLMDN